MAIPCRAASYPSAPAIAISKAGKARAPARCSRARCRPRQPPSQAPSPTHAISWASTMEPIKEIRSRTVVIPNDDIDTDQIIPARFLTTTTKQGLGKNLFNDWRYAKDGSERADFVLNLSLIHISEPTR